MDEHEILAKRVRMIVAGVFFCVALASAYWSLPDSKYHFTWREIALRTVLFSPLFLAGIGAGIGALLNHPLLGLVIGLLITAFFWLNLFFHMPAF